MNKNVVYVVKIYNGENYEQIIGICSDLKTAYNLIKKEIANRMDSYLKYYEEKKWRRTTDTSITKSFEYGSELDDDFEYYDFTITRWEVI